MKPHLFIVTALLIAHGVAFGQELREKRSERILDNGVKVITIERPSDLSVDIYHYNPDGSLQKHVARESHPNGHWICRRSYDAQGHLLAFQTFSYDREWRNCAVRTFNSTGKLVLYSVLATGAGDTGTIYTDDTPKRKSIVLASPEYIKIVIDNHLEAFQ